MSLRADDRSSKSSRSGRDRSRSRYDDDDDSQSKASSKHKSRSRRDDDGDDDKGGDSKSKHRSRRHDDDDEHQSSKSKTRSRRSEADEDVESSSRSKHRSSRYLDDDDDSSSKTKSRSRRQDDDVADLEQSQILSKTKSRTRFEDDEAGAPLTKARSRARFSDDEDARTVTKPRSRYEEQEDDQPLSKSTSRFDDESAAPRKTFSGATLRNKAARFKDDDDHGRDERSSALVTMPEMPGGFDDDDDEHLAYEVRSPSGRTPGLSSLFGGSSSNGRARDDSNEDHGGNRSSRRFESDVRSPRESGGSFFDKEQVRSPKDSKTSYFDPEEQLTEVRRPSRHSVSFNGREETNSLVPYPSADHAFMPSFPSIPGEEPEHRMTLPYGAERPHDYDEDEDHLTYIARPMTRTRTDDHEDRSRPRAKSPKRSISFPQPGADGDDRESRRKSSSGGGLLSVGGAKQATRSRSRDGRLSVSTGDRPQAGSLGRPPASPLLEAYHGTYQSTSPMPSPMMLPETVQDDDGLEEFSLETRRPSAGSALTRKKSVDPKTGKKRVVLYDSDGDADKLAKALNHSTARPEPLIEVLPELTHDQLLALREQYRKRVKVAGRGVNLSKQIKSATTGNFGKVCYVTSLGRWEAESYWANFWYQSHSSNRELLIEALMGKPNAEMREINDGFKDKRYGDSLSLCMEKELKPDKFRAAVLTALEARRQEETDVWPLEIRNRDVETMHRALNSREGGESAILDIVVRRSDNHLRELLKSYERMHRENFARAALAKSNNLVGEVIAHILNGVINRPARDCLLLRHAIKDVTAKNRDVELRYELLISRLVRLHWDRAHLGRVKDEYRHKYGEELEASVNKASHGDFAAFCVRLCET